MLSEGARGLDAFPSVPAVRNGRIYLLYGGYLVLRGRALAQAAEAFARVLHPDVFAERASGWSVAAEP